MIKKRIVFTTPSDETYWHRSFADIDPYFGQEIINRKYAENGSSASDAHGHA